MLVSPYKTENPTGASIKAIKERFFEINRQRLIRTQDSLKWKQRNFLDLLPLFFHINHPELPGYVSKETPAGISLYAPNKQSLEAAKKMASNFKLRDQSVPTRDILSIFIMGSAGTVAQSDHSDIDVWLCYRSTLDDAQLAELTIKCEKIEYWAQEIGLEVHIFPMNAEKFCLGETAQLSTESSGTTQHYLLLDEFYRTSILLAGRYPIWWLIPPEQEKNYDVYINQLAYESLVEKDEAINFGGISKAPVEEFFGAGLWHVYKGVDSPYKSVLKIQLMETYASSYPDCELLCQQFKKKVYEGVTDIDELDPYIMLIRRLEDYLAKRDEVKRLELVRRCFYFKVNVPLSSPERNKDDWQSQSLKELTAKWSWDKNTIEELDKRENWKIHRVLQERKILVENLTQSYLFLSDFARNNASLIRISQSDLNILGRKLYASFERKAGKIDLVNRGVSANVEERKLTLQQVFTKNGDESWCLVNDELEFEQGDGSSKIIRRGQSATELLIWCHFNRIINPSTIISLDIKTGILKVEEVKAILKALENHYPDGELPQTKTDDFQKSPRAVGACAFVNVGMEGLKANVRRNTYVFNDTTDVLNYPGFTSHLDISIDLMVVTSWQEILTFRYTGLVGLLECLCQLLAWNQEIIEGNSFNYSAYGFSFAQGEILAERIETLVGDALKTFYKNNKLQHARYIFEMQGQYKLLELMHEKFAVRSADNIDRLLELLSEPQAEIARIVVDKLALKDSVLPAVFKRHRLGSVQVFYEKPRNIATVYILDGKGAMFTQKLPFYEHGTLIGQYAAFFTTILNRQNMLNQDDELTEILQNIEYYYVARTESGVCKFEQQRLTFEDTESAVANHSGFHLQVIGNVVDQKTVFCIYFEDQEFSSQQYGVELFKEVARYVLSRRPSGERYPVYITDLDLSPALLGENTKHQFHIIEFLNFKKRIEEKINYELIHLR